MIWLLEFLIPALIVSALAMTALVATPDAPPRWRLGLALIGLGGWVVPWPLMELAAELPVVAGLSWSAFPEMAAPEALFAATGSDSVWLWLVLTALLAPGLVWLIADGLAHRGLVSSWRRQSSSGAFLRGWLPEDLRGTRAEIRLVPGTRVAAASGWFRPRVWLGDGFQTPEDLRLALIHECWHVRRRDPVRLALLVALRRLYWWNPLVAYFAREAVLGMESGCDLKCVRVIGRRRYVERLAVMMLDGDAFGASGLLAAARTPNLDVQRLRTLTRSLVLRTRDRVLMACLGIAAAVSIATHRIEAGPLRPAWSQVAIPGTPAGRALTSLLEAFNSGDREFLSAYLGAYTPQEMSLPFYDWTDGLELIEIVLSEPLAIEYLVQDAAGETRRIGRLEVADAERVVVRSSGLRTL